MPDCNLGILLRLNQTTMSIEISLQNIINEATNNQATLLYFFSNQCAPCISLRPKVEELILNDFPSMTIHLIDSEKYTDIAASFGVFSFPTIIIFFEAKELKRYSKYVSVMQLSEAIERPYKMLFGE